MFALPKNAALKRKRCVGVHGYINDFVDSVLALNPESLGSSDALGLADACGNHCHRFTVMYGHPLSQRTF